VPKRDPGQIEDVLSAFQKHRHDVINGLQLIRAYIQMDRPARALSALDDVSRWIGSLSLWTSIVTNESSQLMWVAASCPRILLHSVAPTLRIGSAEAYALASLLQQWDEEASVRGVTCIVVELADPVHSDKVDVRLHATEEMRIWWHNEHKNNEYLHIDIYVIQS